jgi:hypothetical protein
MSPSEVDAEPVTATSAPAVAPQVNAMPNAEPITIEVLRAKLDRAIIAEEWEAVKAIRERIGEVERVPAGNVLNLAEERLRRGR